LILVISGAGERLILKEKKELGVSLSVHLTSLGGVVKGKNSAAGRGKGKWLLKWRPLRREDI